LAEDFEENCSSQQHWIKEGQTYIQQGSYTSENTVYGLLINSLPTTNERTRDDSA